MQHASTGHVDPNFWGSDDFKNLSHQQQMDTMKAYAQSRVLIMPKNQRFGLWNLRNADPNDPAFQRQQMAELMDNDQAFNSAAMTAMPHVLRQATP